MPYLHAIRVRYISRSHLSASQAVTLNLPNCTPRRERVQRKIAGSEKGKVVSKLEAGGGRREGKIGCQLSVCGCEGARSTNRRERRGTLRLYSTDPLLSSLRLRVPVRLCSEPAPFGYRSEPALSLSKGRGLRE